MYPVLSTSGQRRPGIRSTSPHSEGRRWPLASTTRHTSTTPVASAWWPICNGRPDHDIVDRGLTVLERLAHRGASGAEVDTGDGAGILVQIPHRFLAGAAEAAGFTLPDAGRLRRRASPSCRPTPTTPPRRARVVEHMAAEEGLTVLGLARRADRARGPGPDRAGRHAAHRAGLRGAGGRRRRHHGARAPRLRAAQAGRARRRRPLLPVAVGPHASSTRACSPPSSCASSSPTCAIPPSSRAWRWCTRASRPTRSRAGRWRTRTATSATTARSTRWPATATGCGPARRCSRLRSSRETSPASTRSARRARATRPASTRCSSCCISAGARCPTRC